MSLKDYFEAILKDALPLWRELLDAHKIVRGGESAIQEYKEQTGLRVHYSSSVTTSIPWRQGGATANENRTTVGNAQ